MKKPNIAIKYHTQNCWNKSPEYNFNAIVMHRSLGNKKSVINTVMNPKSKASYHYFITKNGKIIEFVPPSKLAWHAGRKNDPQWSKIFDGVNPNRYTLGVCFESVSNEMLSFKQFWNGAKIVGWLAFVYNLKINPETVIQHKQIAIGKPTIFRFWSFRVFRILARIAKRSYIRTA